MGNKADVELVISARDQAAAALDTITAALTRLTANQSGIAESANKSGNALSALGTAATRASEQLKANNAFDQIGKDLAIATAAFNAQQAQLNELDAQYKALNAQTSSAGKVQQDLAAGVTLSSNAVANLKAQLKEAQKAYSDLQKQSTAKAAATLSPDDSKALAEQTALAQQKVDALKGAFQTATAVQNEFTSRLGVVTAAMKTLQTQTDRVGASAEKQRASLEASQSALVQISATANAASVDIARLNTAEAALGQQQGLARVKASMTGFSSLSAVANDLQGIAQAEQRLAIAAEQAGNVTSNSTRKTTLEVKAALLDVQNTAQTGWAEAQSKIRDVAASMAQIGPPTRDQAQNFHTLTLEAQTSKAVFQDIQAAVNNLTQVLRSSASSSSDFVNAQKAAKSAINDAKASYADLASQIARVDAAFRAATGSSDTSASNTSNTVRKSALEAKQALLDVQAIAEGGWASAQAQIRSVATSMAQIGPPTLAEAQAMAKLTLQAQNSKAVFNDLQGALNSLTQVLRSSTAGSAELSSAQKSAQGSIDAARSSLFGLSTQLRAIDAAYQSSADNARRSANSVAAVSSSSAAAQASADALAAAQARLNDGSRESLSLSQRLRGQILSLTASYVGFQSILGQIGDSIKAFQVLEASQSRLRVVFDGDPAKVADELDFIRRTADRLGISFQVLSDEYSKFSVATKGTALEGEKTRDVFVAVAEAGRVNKLTTEQMTGTYLALTQMLSKGQVQAEELRRQLGEKLPGTFKIMADSLGISTAALNKLLEAGGVPSEALIGFAEELRKKFGGQLASALTTTTTQLGKFQNELFQAKLTFAEGGFIDAFTAGLKSLNEFLGSSEAKSDLLKLSQLAGVLAGALLQIPAHVREITVAFAAFIGLRLGSYIAALALTIIDVGVKYRAAAAVIAVSSAGVATAVGEVAAATGILEAVVAGLGGWFSILLSAVAVGIGIWATRTDTATDALVTHRQTVDKVKDAYDEAGRHADQWRDKLKGVTLIGAQADVAKLQQSSDAFFQNFRKQQADARQNAPSFDEVALDQLSAAIDKLQSKQITLEDFRTTLDKVSASAKSLDVKNYALFLEQQTRSGTAFEQTNKALTDAQNVVKAFSNDTKEATAALEALNGNLTLDPAKQAAINLEQYNKSLNAIKASVTNLNKELTDAAKLVKITDDLKAGLDKAADDTQRAAIQTAARRATAAVNPQQFLSTFKSDNLDKSAITGLSDEVAKGLADLLAKLPPDIAKQIVIQKGFITFQDSVQAFNDAKARDPNAVVSTPGTSAAEKGKSFDLSFGSLSPALVNGIVQLMKTDGLIADTVAAVTASGAVSGLLNSATTAISNIQTTAKDARGLRNRNPGNLEPSSKAFQGQTSGVDERFLSFESDIAGIRALAKTLITSQEVHDNNTIQQIIERFSPAKENGQANTQAYINDVAQKTGLGVAQQLNLRDQDTLNKLVNAIIAHENGRNPFQPATVQAGVSAALGKTGLPSVSPSNVQPQTQISFLEQGTATEGAKAQFAQMNQLSESVKKNVADAQTQLDTLTGKSQKDLGLIYEGIAEKNQKAQDDILKLMDYNDKNFDAEVAHLQDLQLKTGESYAAQIANVQALRKEADERANAELNVIAALTAQEQLQAKHKLDLQAAVDAEAELNRVVSLRATIVEQINFLQDKGSTNADPLRLQELKDRLADLDQSLPDVVDNAKQLAITLGGPEGERMLLAIEGLANKAKEAKNAFSGMAEQINRDFASGVTDGLLSITKSIYGAVAGTQSWGDAFHQAGQAFLKFASDFLLQIAKMIIQAEVLQAVQNAQGGASILGLLGIGAASSAAVGAGAGGAITTGADLVLLAHNGAVVGQPGSGGTRAASPGWFTNALRYHGGGLPGLSPSEVPSILLKGEEVLSKNDPRNVLNGGMGGGGNPNVKIVNSFDSAEVVSQGLTSAPGEKAIMNVIRGNKSAIKNILG